MDQHTAVRLLARLGVGPQDIERVRRTPYPQAVALLDELKATVRANWKKLAFELHPDRTGNDPAKTEEFKALSQIRDEFEKLRVDPAPRPMPVPFAYARVVMVPTYTVSPFTSTTSTTVNVWQYVNMRPI